MRDESFQSAPLHAMQPLTRFSNRATDYARYRPGYPEAAIATVLSDLGNPNTLIAADIGAGTGISSRLLTEAGVRVWAIEPNQEMRQTAAPHPGVTYCPGTAEHTGLENSSVDLVTCFQAFHWFEPEPSLREFHRILKPSGRLALVWNNRDRADAFTQGYSRIVQRLSHHHPAEQRLVAAHPLRTTPYFQSVRQHTFPYQQAMDLDGLVGRAQSVSYLPTDEQTQQQLATQLQALFRQWVDAKGLVYLTYQTQIFLADPQATV